MSHFDDALRAYMTELGFITEDRARLILAGQDPVVVDPPPLEPLPITLGRLPASEFVLLVDPAISRTMNAERPRGQAWGAGVLFQKDQTTSYLLTRLPAEHHEGYRLTMDPAGRIESWPMSDGTTVRYGPIERAGRPRFRLASQFRLLDGYHPAHNKWINGWRVNVGVNRAPGHSDAHTFDSPRSGLSAIEADIAFGETAVWYFEIEGHRFMHGEATVTGPLDFHEYGHTYSGPFYSTMGRGKISFGGKRFGQEVIRYGSVSNGDLDDIHYGSIPAPGIGERMRVVVEMKIEAGNNVVKVWTVTDRDMELRVDHTDNLWYVFDDAEKNRKNYPIIQCYPWREHNYPGSDRVRDGHPLWNHDPTVGDVVAAEFGCVGVTTKHAPEDVAGHVLSYPI